TPRRSPYSAGPARTKTSGEPSIHSTTFGVIESTSVGENLALDTRLRGFLSTQSRPSASPAAMPTHAPLRPIAGRSPAGPVGWKADIGTGFLGALSEFLRQAGTPGAKISLMNFFR